MTALEAVHGDVSATFSFLERDSISVLPSSIKESILPLHTDLDFACGIV